MAWNWMQSISKEIFERKYMINEGDESVEDVFRKVSKDVASVEKDKELWEEKFYEEMISGRLVPAGRILANARPETKNRYYNNCYTIDIDDSMEEIYDSLKSDALISATGGGVGFNISKLRPNGSKTSKGGISSGPISFLKVFNESAKIIQTGGFRRSAHIAILDISHPDIEEFITCKQGEQNNVLTQFNISVGITDKFMKAVEDDADWDLVFNDKIYKTVKAKYLYDLIMKNAHYHNEPGLFFLDRVNKDNNAPDSFIVDRSNPCGEICVSGDTKVNTDFGILPITEVIDYYERGVDINVYSVSSVGEIELNKVLWGGKTGINSQLIEIELKNGNVLRVTPNHKLFISPTQTMTAIEYLSMWQSLSNRSKRRGEYPHIVYLNRSMMNEHYIKVKASSQKNYVLEHHLNYGEKIDSGYNVHHIDGNSLNNSKDNLEVLTHSEHSRITNIGHEDYSKGKDVKSKDILKHHGDAPNTSTIVDVRWGGKEDVYDITVENNHNFFASGLLIHNCMPSWSLCCLSSVNFTQFVKNSFEDNATLDFTSLKKTIDVGIRFLDNVLDVTKYPLEKIEKFSKEWRRIGLGFTGYADMLAMMKMPYSSEEAKVFTEELAKFFRDKSYETSIEIAKEKGAYPEFRKEEIEKSGFFKKLPKSIRESIQLYGLRNIGINTVAPNGTISLTIGQNCSSGIEPIFSLDYNRKVRTGRGDETTTEKVYDYAWLLYQQKKVFEEGAEDIEVPDFFQTTFDISPYQGIDIQAIWQEYIDHSISKTVNLPNGFTFDDYENLFEYAYNKGLKGITSFNPEGSISGILSSSSKTDTPKSIKRNDAPKRPESLPCDIHEITVNKEKHLVLCGFNEGIMFEIFVTPNPDNKIDMEKHKTGFIKKVKKGVYELVVKNGEDRTVIPNIGQAFDPLYGSLSRFISMSLRHGVPMKFIVDQLQKDSGFISFERAVSRVLKKYIKDGELSTQKCSECGDTMQYRDGCIICPSCGNSKCS